MDLFEVGQEVTYTDYIHNGKGGVEEIKITAKVIRFIEGKELVLDNGVTFEYFVGTMQQYDKHKENSRNS